jgi:hypothetical protein
MTHRTGVVASRSASSNGKLHRRDRGQRPESCRRDNKPARNGELKRTIDDVREWMHLHCPELGVDALLCHPFDALAMGLSIGRKREWIDEPTHAAIVDALTALRKQFPSAIGAIDEVCRAAMNGRKRRLLKPALSTPGSRAAATRAARREGRT